MTTDDIDLDGTLDIVRRSARAAAARILAGYRTRPEAEHKGSVELVTRYDVESEAWLRQALEAALPWPVVGEESGGTPGALALYVDPLDGTTNFVHGHPFWAVSIGLASADEAILGVVVAPVLGIEWAGYSHRGQTLAERRWAKSPLLEETPAPLLDVGPCRVSTTDTLRASLLATGFPYDCATSQDNNFDAFVHIQQRCRGVRRCGSAAIDLCLVADGTYDGYWERKLRPWDLAAGAALVRAAGGRVSGPGAPATLLGTGHVVATNGFVHDELLRELACV